MTPEQINAALAKLGLSPKEAGRLFRHDERTVFRWKAGDRGIPQGIAILLHLMLDGKISKADVAAATAVVFD
jgi:hypothetical protein